MIRIIGIARERTACPGSRRIKGVSECWRSDTLHKITRKNKKKHQSAHLLQRLDLWIWFLVDTSQRYFLRRVYTSCNACSGGGTLMSERLIMHMRSVFDTRRKGEVRYSINVLNFIFYERVEWISFNVCIRSSMRKMKWKPEGRIDRNKKYLQVEYVNDFMINFFWAKSFSSTKRLERK